MSDIFLSYRRGDVPGYVGRLADGLTNAFGDVVFRDVDSIRGGEQWKLTLQKQVSQAQLVLAIIGERWQSILAERDPEADYIRFELNLAKMLDIPVIPVRLQDAPFDHEQDLGDLSWLHELQSFELSDRQRRWERDLDQLVEHIENLTSLKRVEKPEAKPSEPGGTKVTHGDRSPIVDSQSGNVTISYGESDKD